jgi:hypothetical protein
VVAITVLNLGEGLIGIERSVQRHRNIGLLCDEVLLIVAVLPQHLGNEPISYLADLVNAMAA